MNKKNKLLSLTILLLGIFYILPLDAQRKNKKTDNPEEEMAVEPIFKEDLYASVKYRSIGPFRGGRSAAVSWCTRETNGIFVWCYWRRHLENKKWWTILE